MKRIFGIVLLLFLFVTFEVSCQKEIENDGGIILSGESISLPLKENSADSSAKCVSKRGFGKKFSQVRILQDDLELSSAVVHKTIKIRDIKGSICQEWLYENLYSTVWQGIGQPGDESGEKYGLYYQWHRNFSDVSQSDWDLCIYNAVNDENELGFHIPNEDDFDNLANIIGGQEYIFEVLGMTPRGDYKNTIVEIKLNNACYWMIPPRHYGRQQPGCGVFIHNGGARKFTVAFTNVPDLHCGLRLVRTIKKEEW